MKGTSSHIHLPINYLGLYLPFITSLLQKNVQIYGVQIPRKYICESKNLKKSASKKIVTLMKDSFLLADSKL